MVPVIDIAGVISFILSVAIFLRLFKSYLESRRSDALLRHFSSFFFFLMMAFLLSFPALVWNRARGDMAGIQVVLSYLFLAFATGSFIRIPVNLWFGHRAGRVVAWSAYLIGIAAFVLGIVFYTPAVWEVSEGGDISVGYFILYQPIQIRIFNGGAPILIALAGSVFFLIEGWRSENIRMRIRSILMGFGMLFLLGAAVTNFFISNMILNLVPLLVTSILSVAGLVLMGIAAYFIEAKTEISKNIIAKRLLL